MIGLCYQNSAAYDDVLQVRVASFSPSKLVAGWLRCKLNAEMLIKSIVLCYPNSADNLTNDNVGVIQVLVEKNTYYTCFIRSLHSTASHRVRVYPNSSKRRA